jgi:hypothetical protein
MMNRELRGVGSITSESSVETVSNSIVSVSCEIQTAGPIAS